MLPFAPAAQLSLYATLRWYVEQEAPGHESRMRSLGARDLLFQLPHLQRLQVGTCACAGGVGAVVEGRLPVAAALLVGQAARKVWCGVVRMLQTCSWQGTMWCCLLQ